ncbi:hypothetical protein N800_03685 [Lysobacter daejeonensis GH1-9]|uniref:Uncharacterized protein n=1 Tax=Lysobacter daejeonensis GH1-9 TaxID=1385517 RepID=A0A0A0EXK7_9GAMM|nr:hypothetical protein N800_03685 [Lysobacter daejeonensis GH1-9]
MIARSPLLAALILTILCAAPFAPGLTGPFLLDDWGNLEPLLNVNPSLESIYAAVFNNASGVLLRPVSNLSFAMNLLLAGPYPLPFKLTNLAIHLITGGLAFFVSQSLLRILAPAASERRVLLSALFAAIIWAVHPLQVSTVLYVVQRMTMLSALFMLIAILVATRFLTDTTKHGARHWLKSFVLYAAATFLAVLSKENGALVPLILLAIFLAAPPEARATLFGTREKKLFWLGGVVAPMMVAVVCLLIGWNSLMGFSGRSFTLVERLLTEPFVLMGYVRTILIPAPSVMGLFLDDTPIRSAADPLAWATLVAFLAIPVIAVRLHKRFPMFAFAILWFLACHAMESTVLPLELAFEHRNYLALLGPAIATAYGLLGLFEHYSPRLTGAAVLATVAALGFTTFHRASQWSSEETFALTEARNHPDSIRAQNLAGIVERRRGNMTSAIARMDAMKKAHPNEFFPFAMDMDFACDSTGHEVDWAGIHRTAARDIGGSEVLGYFNHISIVVANGSCQGISWRQLDAHLVRLADEAKRQRSTWAQQYFTVLRASLRENIDPPAASELFYQAADLDPKAKDIWTRIAMFEIAQNNRAQALVALNTAESQTPTWSPSAKRLAQLRATAESLQR